jgi:hypothetical protein
VKERHGDAATPLWVTETGISTTGFDERFRRTEADQATGIVDLYRRLKPEPDVNAILINSLVDQLADPGENGFGLVRADLSRKPAYCALAMAVRKLRSCP